MWQIFERIKHLTDKDLENKTIFELLASATEEQGELAREIKIEEGTFGNTYKHIDEGSKAEAIDVIIMGLSIFYARGGTTEELPLYIDKKLDKWEAKR